MPYPNYHAARLRDPGDFVRIRQIGGSKSKGIRILGGPLKSKPDGPTVAQAIRFKAAQWTVSRAKAWLGEHGYKPIAFEPATGNAQSRADYAFECCDCGYLMASWSGGDCEWCAGGVRAIEADDGAGHGAVTVVEAADGGVRVRVAGVAYSGGKMRLPGWSQPVVVDLAGLEIPETVPLLTNHENRTGSQVGAVRARVENNTLLIEGDIVSSSGQARGIVEQARAGVNWQLSIGAQPRTVELVRKSREVNGRLHEGPFYHVRSARLREVSVIPCGADETTHMRIAAASHFVEDVTMKTFEEWLKAKGVDVEKIDEPTKKALKAAYEAELKAQKAKDAGDGQDPPKDPKDAAPAKDADKPVKAGAASDPAADIIARQADALDRAAAIRKLCGDDHPDIAAKALKAGWDLERTKVEIEVAGLRASMPTPVKVGGSNRDTTPKILEAAIRLGGAEDAAVVEKAYEESILDRAGRFRFAGLKDLIAMCCQMDGVQVPARGADPETWLEAAFSTTTLSGLLGNTANKVLMTAYRATPLICTRIAEKLTANDFKTHTGYRMTGDMTLDEVPPSGEIKHAALNEDSYTFSVDTYGKMVTLTRREIINDDLNAFTQLPKAMGRGAALKLAKLFWTLVLANTGNFFHANNSNLITNVLGDAGLTAAAKTLIEQTDQDGNPILITPKLLVVPPALFDTGQRLFESRNIIITGSTAATKGDKNIHEGKYEPVTTSFLSNTTFHAGASDAAWYLFGNPADVAAFGIAYLKGNETPTFESVTMPSNVLGKGWRIYWDIGVCQVDSRGAVKSTGAG